MTCRNWLQTSGNMDIGWKHQVTWTSPVLSLRVSCIIKTSNVKRVGRPGGGRGGPGGDRGLPAWVARALAVQEASPSPFKLGSPAGRRKSRLKIRSWGRHGSIKESIMNGFKFLVSTVSTVTVPWDLGFTRFDITSDGKLELNHQERVLSQMCL